MSMDSLANAWRAIDDGATPPPLHVVAEEARRLQATVRRRNALEYFAGAVVVALFGWDAWTTAYPLLRLGDLSVAAAALFVCWQIHRRTMPAAAVPTLEARTAALGLGRDLRQQAEALAGVWRWYLLPFLPGFLMLALGRIAAREPSHQLAAAGGEALFLLVLAVVFYVVWRLNSAAARDLDRSARELESFWTSRD